MGSERIPGEYLGKKEAGNLVPSQGRTLPKVLIFSGNVVRDVMSTYTKYELDRSSSTKVRGSGAKKVKNSKIETKEDRDLKPIPRDSPCR